VYIFFGDLFGNILLWKRHDIEDIFFYFFVSFLENIFLVLNSNPPDDEIEKEQERKAKQKNKAIRDYEERSVHFLSS
jgi:hypothetical protein